MSLLKSRRSFLSNAAVTGIGYGVLAAVPLDFLSAIRKKVSALETINIGLIGCRGQGWSNLTSMLKIPGTTCIALCDIDKNVLEQRKVELEKINIKTQLYSDYRDLLRNKDIDVVIIATPDHWHCLQLIESCAAGKDIFVEKPLANSIYETELMRKTALASSSIIQVNQWQRSQQHFQNAVAFVGSGKLGKINSTKSWMYRGGTQPLPVLANEPVPAGVDYNMWLGPSHKLPFNKNRFHYEFRWFWDYAGGLMTDWGVHLIDIVLQGMKVESPRSVIASGGKLVFPGDARETPDILSAIYDYGNFQMTWEHNMSNGVGLYGLQHGIAFIGENGTLLLNRGGWEVRPDKNKEQLKMEAVAWQASVDRGLDKHTENFIEAVRTRKKEILNCPLEAGARASLNAHMGNIAYRSGEMVKWNQSTRKFNSAKADKLVKPNYENGWKLPNLV